MIRAVRLWGWSTQLPCYSSDSAAVRGLACSPTVVIFVGSAVAWGVAQGLLLRSARAGLSHYRPGSALVPGVGPQASTL